MAALSLISAVLGLFKALAPLALLIGAAVAAAREQAIGAGQQAGADNAVTAAAQARIAAAEAQDTDPKAALYRLRQRSF